MLQIFLILGACLLDLTFAHNDQTALSSSLPTTTSLSLGISHSSNTLVSSKTSLVTFTPPFTGQTLVSILRPECPHNGTLSSLGCREPTTVISPTPNLESTSIILSPRATDVIVKTVITVTRTLTVWVSSGTVLSTKANKNKGRQALDDNGIGSVTESKSREKVNIRAVSTVTSIININGILNIPETPQSLPTSTSASASGPHLSWTSTSTSTSPSIPKSVRSPVAKNAGLRSAKNPWLILAICCAGAIMFEAGIWKEKEDEGRKKQTVVQCDKCLKYHKFVDKDSVEEAPEFVPECRRIYDKVGKEAEGNKPQDEDKGKGKECVAVEDNRGSDEKLSDWDLV